VRALSPPIHLSRNQTLRDGIGSAAIRRTPQSCVRGSIVCVMILRHCETSELVLFRRIIWASNIPRCLVIIRCAHQPLTLLRYPCELSVVLFRTLLSQFSTSYKSIMHNLSIFAHVFGDASRTDLIVTVADSAYTPHGRHLLSRTTARGAIAVRRALRRVTTRVTSLFEINNALATFRNGILTDGPYPPSTRWAITVGDDSDALATLATAVNSLRALQYQHNIPQLQHTMAHMGQHQFTRNLRVALAHARAEKRQQLLARVEAIVQYEITREQRDFDAENALRLAFRRRCGVGPEGRHWIQAPFQ
jgi:hypothetical protein